VFDKRHCLALYESVTVSTAHRFAISRCVHMAIILYMSTNELWTYHY